MKPTAQIPGCFRSSLTRLAPSLTKEGWHSGGCMWLQPEHGQASEKQAAAHVQWSGYERDDIHDLEVVEDRDDVLPEELLGKCES